MNYSKIKFCDIANGPGVRTSLFVSGCDKQCEGCFNQETWDYNNGAEFTDKEMNKIIISLQYYFINGLSILGGEPLAKQNRECVYNIISKVIDAYKDKKNLDIWLYTGYTWEELMEEHDPVIDGILHNIDVLVDGPFILCKRDISLEFRGSSNQRIIDVPKSLRSDRVILY